MSAETQSADADNDGEAQDDTTEDEFTYYPQVTQHPTSLIEGDIVDIVTGADIDGDSEDTGSSFGVVFENPEVEGGTLWRNDHIPEGFDSSAEFNDALKVAIQGDDIDYIRGQEVTEEFIEDARKRVGDVLGVTEFEDVSYEAESVNGTDYKVADPDDRDAEVGYDQNGDEKGIDVGGGTFESSQVENFGDADKVMVWYGGMAGQFIGRGLDFNGMAFARYTAPDDGDLPYLVKGLFQVPLGWRGDADIDQYGGDAVETTDRSKLARAEKNGGLGRAPRVARPPVLRDDLDGRSFIAIGRYNGGNMHEVHIGRAEDDYTDIMEAINADEDDVDDLYDAIDMRYDQSADETLNAEFDNPASIYGLYEGEGWLTVPDETQDALDADGDSGGSFDTPDVDIDGDSVDHPTEQEVEFAEGIAEKLAGTGVSPEDDIFPTDEGNVDLEGIVQANTDQFQVTPDVDAIREVVYENTSHLSTEDL